MLAEYNKSVTTNSSLSASQLPFPIQIWDEFVSVFQTPSSTTIASSEEFQKDDTTSIEWQIVSNSEFWKQVAEWYQCIQRDYSAAYLCVNIQRCFERDKCDWKVQKSTYETLREYLYHMIFLSSPKRRSSLSIGSSEMTTTTTTSSTSSSNTISYQNRSFQSIKTTEKQKLNDFHEIWNMIHYSIHHLLDTPTCPNYIKEIWDQLFDWISNYCEALVNGKLENLSLAIEQFTTLLQQLEEQSITLQQQQSFLFDIVETLKGMCYTERAAIYKMTYNHYEDALKDLTCMLQIFPSFAYGFYCRACIKADIFQQITDAIEDLSCAIEIDEEYKAAYQKRSSLYANSGCLTRALQDLQIILQLDPQTMDSREQLMYLLMDHLNMYDEAMKQCIQISHGHKVKNLVSQALRSKLWKLLSDSTETYLQKKEIQQWNGLYTKVAFQNTSDVLCSDKYTNNEWQERDLDTMQDIITNRIIL